MSHCKAVLGFPTFRAGSQRLKRGQSFQPVTKSRQNLSKHCPAWENAWPEGHRAVLGCQRDSWKSRRKPGLSGSLCESAAHWPHNLVWLGLCSEKVELHSCSQSWLRSTAATADVSTLLKTGVLCREPPINVTYATPRTGESQISASPGLCGALDVRQLQEAWLPWGGLQENLSSRGPELEPACHISNTQKLRKTDF